VAVALVGGRQGADRRGGVSVRGDGVGGGAEAQYPLAAAVRLAAGDADRGRRAADALRASAGGGG